MNVLQTGNPNGCVFLHDQTYNWDTAIDQTIKKHSTILLSIFIVLFYSTSNMAEPHQVINWVDNPAIHISSHNIAIQVHNDKIYVLCKNCQVFVFDVRS